MDLVDPSAILVDRTVCRVEGFKIAAGAEDTVGACHDQGTDFTIILSGAKEFQQIVLEVLRKRIALLRAGECDDTHAVLHLISQCLVGFSHGFLSLSRSWSNQSLTPCVAAFRHKTSLAFRNLRKEMGRCSVNCCCGLCSVPAYHPHLQISMRTANRRPARSCCDRRACPDRSGDIRSSTQAKFRMAAPCQLKSRAPLAGTQNSGLFRWRTDPDQCKSTQSTF